MAAQQEPRKPALSGRALGLILIFLTAVIWVAASFISQLLVTSGDGRPSYNVSPFLLTYLSTSIFTVFLPLVQLKSLLQETWLLRYVHLRSSTARAMLLPLVTQLAATRHATMSTAPKALHTLSLCSHSTPCYAIERLSYAPHTGPANPALLMLPW